MYIIIICLALKARMFTNSMITKVYKSKQAKYYVIDYKLITHMKGKKRYSLAKLLKRARYVNQHA